MTPDQLSSMVILDDSSAFQSSLDEDSSWTSPATEDTATMPGTPVDELDESALTSTEVSPTKESFATIRQREVQAEAANALMYQKPPFRRRSSVKPRPDSPLEHHKRQPSISSLLPWSCPVPTRKISVSSTGSRPNMRRLSTAQTTAENSPEGLTHESLLNNKSSFEGLKRRPSQLSVCMRRESIAEKTKAQQIYISSPKLSPRGIKDLRSPMSTNSFGSHWSPDNSDREDNDEAGSDGEVPVAQFSTARRVSRTDSPASQMLPIFLRASKVTREDLHARRPSNLSLLSKISSSAQHSAAASFTLPTSTAGGNGGNGGEKTELVRLVTALQATHLDETRRLNEIIAELSKKVASLERDLLYSTNTPSSTCSPLNATFPPLSPAPHATTPAAYLASPRGSEVKWRTTAAYRLDAPMQFDRSDSACAMRRMSAMSSSPRTAPMNYI